MSPGAGNFWWESCSIGKTVVCFLIDTGSQVTVFPQSLAIRTGLCIGPATSQVLRAFGGSFAKVLGKISDSVINCTPKICSGGILVTADGTKPILSMDFLPSFQLVRVRTTFSAQFWIHSQFSLEE